MGCFIREPSTTTGWLAQADIHLGVAAQQVKAVLGHGVADQDLVHLHCYFLLRA